MTGELIRLRRHEFLVTQARWLSGLDPAWRRTCPRCRVSYLPKSPEQVCCTRRCSDRLREGRNGRPVFCIGCDTRIGSRRCPRGVCDVCINKARHFCLSKTRYPTPEAVTGGIPYFCGLCRSYHAGGAMSRRPDRYTENAQLAVRLRPAYGSLMADFDRWGGVAQFVRATGRPRTALGSAKAAREHQRQQRKAASSADPTRAT